MFDALRLLRSRNYALVWWSGLVSNAGTWMQAVAIGALVTSLTNSAGWGGLVAGASFLAAGLFTPFGGVVADKHDRRLLLQVSSSALAVVSIALAVLYHLDVVTPSVLLIAVVIEGVMTAFLFPATIAMVPDLVPKERVAEASAMTNASWNLGRCIGPALAGIVIAQGSYSLVFTFNAITCAVVALAMLFVRVPHVPQHSTDSFMDRLREGFRGAREDEGCWAAIRFIAITGVLVSPFIALMPAMAQLVFDGTEVDTAHFVMAQGVGSVIGAFSFATLVRRFGSRRVVITLLVALPFCEMAFALAPVKWMGIVGAFFLGATYIAITVGMTVVVQLRAAPALRGRILAFSFTTLSLSYPLGAFVQGRLGDLIGIREVLFSAALIDLLVLGAIALWSAERFRVLGPRVAPV